MLSYFNTVLLEGIISGKRECLARAITLIESSRHDHQIQAQILLQKLIESQQKLERSYFNDNKSHTLRLGIAGPPGAGKSTFIENLGMRLIEQNHRVAVIPVDPSSPISGGSILGDKTRMDMLSRERHAYIRASPTRGVLGGIAEHTADVIALCEAANYDTVIIESVGLGQSEVDIERAVDMLLLLVPPASGDSLQASKKGIMEAVDMVVVTKADGDMIHPAAQTQADYTNALHFIKNKYHQYYYHPFHQKTSSCSSSSSSFSSSLSFSQEINCNINNNSNSNNNNNNIRNNSGNNISNNISNNSNNSNNNNHNSANIPISKMDWSVPVVLFSNQLTQTSPPYNHYLDIIENHIKTFHTLLIHSNIINIKRNQQKLFWMESKMKRMLIDKMEVNQEVGRLRKGEISERVMKDEITPATAAKLLLDTFYDSIRHH